jgi:hypothetical protein
MVCVMDTWVERQLVMNAYGLMLRETSVVELEERPKNHRSGHHRIQRGRSRIWLLPEEKLDHSIS